MHALWESAQAFGSAEGNIESHPDEVFNNLFSVITDGLLWTAFRRLKRNKAPGVDDVTVDQYEENLDANLRTSFSSQASRKWEPTDVGKNRKPGDPDNTGEFHDRLETKSLCMGPATD